MNIYRTLVAAKTLTLAARDIEQINKEQIQKVFKVCFN